MNDSLAYNAADDSSFRLTAAATQLTNNDSRVEPKLAERRRHVVKVRLLTGISHCRKSTQLTRAGIVRFLTSSTSLVMDTLWAGVHCSMF